MPRGSSPPDDEAQRAAPLVSNPSGSPRLSFRDRLVVAVIAAATGLFYTIHRMGELTEKVAASEKTIATIIAAIITTIIVMIIATLIPRLLPRLLPRLFHDYSTSIQY